jgi:hypothetical protein
VTALLCSATVMFANVRRQSLNWPGVDTDVVEPGFRTSRVRLWSTRAGPRGGLGKPRGVVPGGRNLGGAGNAVAGNVGPNSGLGKNMNPRGGEGPRGSGATARGAASGSRGTPRAGRGVPGAGGPRGSHL